MGVTSGPAAPEVDVQEVPAIAGAEPLLGSSPSSKETVSEIGGNGVRAKFNRVRRRFQGWRAGASICATTVGTVLAVNTLLLIIASAVNDGSGGGLATIQTGDCKKSENLDTWLHLLINILSTMLLASSKYCMQCLSSPTRDDIDKAHAQGKWLDVGIHSVRNLGRIPRFRLLLWSLLALSSVPIHLLFNSTLVLTRASNEYALFVGSPLLLTGDGGDWSKPIGHFLSLQYHIMMEDEDATAYEPPPVKQFRDIALWDNLTNEACIKAYSETYLVGRGDLVMITSDLNASVPMLLAREKLNDSLALSQQSKFGPLVTIGDAIESFMLKKDATTQDMCLADKAAFKNHNWRRVAKPWLRKGRFWFASASITRWALCSISSILTFVIAGVLLGQGLGEAKISQSTTFSTSGFGTLNTDLMAKLRSPLSRISVVGAAVVTNTPQLLVSILFLGFNSLYTCMLLADEWNGYARERKPLRVSQPSWRQRSTYFLQLPYRYGVPLMIMSILLHWLLSESLFLARVAVYRRDGTEDGYNWISTIGYSLIPLVVVIALGCTTVLAGLFNGFRRYKPGIPLAGSCSAAISAACHTPENDLHAVEKPIMWGVVGTNKDGIGHCSFTSLEVSRPKEGEIYAGF